MVNLKTKLDDLDVNRLKNAPIDLKKLTIPTWKNLCFTEKIHLNIKLAASEVFHMFTQSMKFFEFHYCTDI